MKAGLYLLRGRDDGHLEVARNDGSNRERPWQMLGYAWFWTTWLVNQRYTIIGCLTDDVSPKVYGQSTIMIDTQEATS